MASRRTAEDMIRDGRVTVDGEPAHLGQKIDVEEAHVEIDGVPLPVKPGLVHYLLYKPAGVISTADDPQGRPTVLDLVPGDTRVYPVGRLDADSEGLLIITNDGDLTHHITHPSRGVTKTYLARVQGDPDVRTIARLVSGIDLEDGPAMAISARRIDAFGGETLIEVVLGEGRKREARRMLDAVGHPVTALVRTAIGPIKDRSLTQGSWRSLTLDEIRSLYSAGLVA